jgi:hypothetical protein
MADEIVHKEAENGAESAPTDLPSWAQWLLEAAAFADFAKRCPHRVANESCNLRDRAPCDPDFCLCYKKGAEFSGFDQNQGGGAVGRKGKEAGDYVG